MAAAGLSTFGYERNLEEGAAGAKALFGPVADEMALEEGRATSIAKDFYNKISEVISAHISPYRDIIGDIFGGLFVRDTDDISPDDSDYSLSEEAPAAAGAGAVAAPGTIQVVRRSARLAEVAAAAAAAPAPAQGILSGSKRRRNNAVQNTITKDTAPIKATKKVRPEKLEQSPYENLKQRLRADMTGKEDKFIKLLILIDSLHDFAKARDGYSYNAQMRKHIANSYASKYSGKPYSNAANEATMLADLKSAGISFTNFEDNVIKFLRKNLSSLLSTPVDIDLSTIDSKFATIDAKIYTKPIVEINVEDAIDSTNLHRFIDKFLLGNIVSPAINVTIDGYPNRIVTTTLEKHSDPARTYYQIITPQNVLDSSTTSTTHFSVPERMKYTRIEHVLQRSDVTIGTFNYDIDINRPNNPPLSGLYKWFKVNVTRKIGGALIDTLQLDAAHPNGTSVRSIGEYVKAQDSAQTSVALSAAIAAVETEPNMKSLKLGTLLMKTSRPEEYIDTALDQKYGGDSGQYNAAYWLNIKGIPTIFATADKYAAYMAAIQGVPTILGLPSSIILFKGSNYKPSEKEQYKTSIFNNIAKLNSIFTQLESIRTLDIAGTTLNSLYHNIIVNIGTWKFKSQWKASGPWYELLIKLRAIDILKYLIEKRRKLDEVRAGIDTVLASFIGSVPPDSRINGINIVINDGIIDGMSITDLRQLDIQFKSIVDQLNGIIAGSGIIDESVIQFNSDAANKFIFGNTSKIFFTADSTVGKIEQFNYNKDLYDKSAYITDINNWLKSAAGGATAGAAEPIFELCKQKLENYVATFLNTDFVDVSIIIGAFENRNKDVLEAYVTQKIMSVLNPPAGAATHGGSLLGIAIPGPNPQKMPKSALSGPNPQKMPKGSYKPKLLKLEPNPQEESLSQYATSALKVYELIAEAFKNIPGIEIHPIPDVIESISKPNFAAEYIGLVINTFQTILRGSYEVSQETDETILKSRYDDFKTMWLNLIGNLESQTESESTIAICAPLTDYFKQNEYSKTLLDAFAYFYYVAFVDQRIFRLYDGEFTVFGITLTNDTVKITDSNIGAYIAALAAASETAVSQLAEHLSFHTGAPVLPFIPGDVPAFFDPLTGAELSSARSALLASQPLTGEATEEGQAIIAEAEAKAAPAKEETKEEGLTSEITNFLEQLGLKGGARKSRHRKTVATRRKQKRRVTRKKWPGNKRASRRRA